MDVASIMLGGEYYYPSSHTDDWIACFETKQQAEEYLKTAERNYDWHEIVDLREWIGVTDEF